MRRRIVLGATAGALAVIGIAYPTSRHTIEADDKPPIVAQVEDHEVRITDLESRADDTEARVEQNTQAIVRVEERVVSRQSPAPQQAIDVPSTPSEPQQPAPSPQPEPEPDPYTIVKVEVEPQYLGDGKHFANNCRYYLHARKVATITNGLSAPCFESGTILPEGYRYKLVQYTETW